MAENPEINRGAIGAEQGGLRLAGEGQLESLKTRNLGPSTHLHCTPLSSSAYFATYRNYSTQPQTRQISNSSFAHQLSRDE